MDVEKVIHALASAGDNLPRDAMRWALDNWDEASPGLLGLLERYADGTDRSEEAASAVFFILHLAGEKRETRAFPLLCRLARDAEAIEEALGDGITTTLKRIMISTYDGDLDALKGVIEAAEADEFVRHAALEAFAYLTATGRIARDEAQTYLRRLYDEMQPQDENPAWVGWVMAVSLLGLEALSDVVRRAFRRGLIDRMVMGYDHFREDLGQTLANPERMAGFERDRIKPLDDAVGELSSWYAFSEEAKRERERIALDRLSAGLAAPAAPQPFVPLPSRPAANLLKDVGRNDPCPCGSGKKYKKCCLK